MAADSPEALAKQLRDTAVKRHEYPVSAVRELVEGWRRDLGLDPEAYVNIGNANGKAPLHFAAQLRDDGLAELMLELCANVHATTARGHTALIYACGRGRNRAVLSLLNAGARCRVKTANGDTAQLMARGRLPKETIEALDRAEASEQSPWLDFTVDERAIVAQADHVQRHPRSAQWACDTPAAVAEILEQRQRAAAQKPSEAAAVETLTAELLPCWHERERLADALLRTAGQLSRKQAVTVSRAAVLAVAGDERAGEEEERLLALLQVAGPPLSEAARALSAAGELGPRRAKEAKVAVTSAVLGALRQLRTGTGLSVPMLAAHAPAWMTVELLSPPVGVVLEDDGPSLEAVLRKLCHERAWGSDFGTALRWLAALRPPAPAQAAAQAAFNGLVAAFVDVAVAACNAGHSFKRYLKDEGTLLREATEVLGEEALAPLLQICNPGSLRRGRGAAPAAARHPPPPLPAEGKPFLRLPEEVEVHWVDDASSWSAAESLLEAASVVAVDTEWWDTGSGPALVQLAIGEGLGSATCFLLDTLTAPHVLGPGLGRLFARQDLDVLGWSFSEDRKRLAELCCLACGEATGAEAAAPATFVATDLQPAVCQLLGSSSPVSLAVASAHFVGQPLDKTEQCSDWRRRPLTKQQEEYAALDAAVLLELHAELLRYGALEASEPSPAAGSAEVAPEAPGPSRSEDARGVLVEVA